MKKLSKILSIVIIVTMLSIVCTNVFAAINMDAITGDDGTEADGVITTIGNKVLSIITSVGMILAIILVAVLGIKYMMGSTSEKAEYKKSMIPYLIGAVLVFGAAAIGKAVVGFGQTVANTAVTPGA